METSNLLIMLVSAIAVVATLAAERFAPVVAGFFSHATHTHTRTDEACDSRHARH